MVKDFVYVIIAPSSWDHPKIKYRRHRFARYLLEQNDTREVFWVYPESASFRKAGSFAKKNKEIADRFSFHKSENGLIEVALPDFLPGRWMQYKSSCGNKYFKKLGRMLKSYASRMVLWYTYPAYPYLSNLIKWDKVIYDCSDLWKKPSSGFRPTDFSSLIAENFIESAERMIFNKSGILIASSEYLAARIHRESGKVAVLIENGVDSSKFKLKSNAVETIYKDIPRPRLGYVGGMRGKVDFELLETLARDNLAWSIVLVGPNYLDGEAVFENLVNRDNVYYFGAVAEDLIPDYIGGLQLGLLPYRDTDYNKGIFPLKFYEYFAQGLPVVGCGLPSTKKLVKDRLYLHVNRDDYQKACESALRWDTNEDEREANLNRRLEFAKGALWENKFLVMYGLIKDRTDFYA